MDHPVGGIGAVLLRHRLRMLCDSGFWSRGAQPLRAAVLSCSGVSDNAVPPLLLLWEEAFGGGAVPPCGTYSVREQYLPMPVWLSPDSGTEGSLGVGMVVSADSVKAHRQGEV